MVKYFFQILVLCDALLLELRLTCLWVLLRQTNPPDFGEIGLIKLAFTLNQIYKKPQELLAPVETASFFVIAMACIFYGSLPFVRNNKKDTVENGTELSEKIQFFCS